MELLNLHKSVLSSSPSEGGSCSSKNEHDRRVICCGEKITKTKAATSKIVMDSSLGEDVGIRDNFLLYLPIRIE